MRIPGSNSYHAAALFAAVVAAFTGCAGKQSNSASPVPREDLAEYRQVAADAHRVVQAALTSLDRATAQTPCPPRMVRAFAKDVERLEVDSFRLRARAQAIRERGNDYFEQWHQHLQHVKDPAARQRAVARRERLQERFDHIRLLTQDAREAFQPFLAGLHRVRNGLERNPGLASTDAMKETIRTTRENGKKVEASIASVLGELDAVAVILRPDKNPKKG